MLGARPPSSTVYPAPLPPVNVPTGSRSRTPSGLPRPKVWGDALVPVEDELRAPGRFERDGGHPDQGHDGEPSRCGGSSRPAWSSSSPNDIP